MRCTRAFICSRIPSSLQRARVRPFVSEPSRELTGVGFGEGGTQAITEAVMGQQNICRYYRDAPYEEFTKPMRKLIGVFGVHGFARAYFLGETDAFTKTMESRWGRRWMQVAGLTNLRKPKDACAEIDRLETAHFNWLQRRGPKGDFPAPTRFSKYA